MRNTSWNPLQVDNSDRLASQVAKAAHVCDSESRLRAARAFLTEHWSVGLDWFTSPRSVLDPDYYRGFCREPKSLVAVVDRELHVRSLAGAMLAEFGLETGAFRFYGVHLIVVARLLQAPWLTDYVERTQAKQLKLDEMTRDDLNIRVATVLDGASVAGAIVLARPSMEVGR